VSCFVSSGCSAAPGTVIFFGGMTRVDALPNIVEVSTLEVGACWGPSSSEGPQKHDLTMFLEYNT
jgi:hypothetical protein